MSRRLHDTRSPLKEGPAVVALGGGHGLAASLQALRRVTNRLTAVVTVADDGGSSGRLRAEFGVLPPGDLRMALAALCGDDTWGRTWERVVQHRFAGDGDLGGHSLGNMLITALWQNTSDPVEGLDWVAALLEAQGRVLPCSLTPLEIVADIKGDDPGAPNDVRLVRGQVAVASTAGEVLQIGLEPADAPACTEAITAVENADAIVLGPGSWFTSLMPHLLLRDLHDAIVRSSAQRILIVNLDPQRGETSHFSAHAHVEVLHEMFPEVTFNAVVADPAHVEDQVALGRASANMGAELVLADVGSPGVRGQHDPQRLAVVFDSLLGLRA